MNAKANTINREAKVRGKKIAPVRKPQPARKGKAPKQQPSPEPATSLAKASLSKQAKVIELLRRSTGATIDDLVDATGWQAHSVRGALSGALKKKLKLTIDSEKVEGRGRVYRIR